MVKENWNNEGKRRRVLIPERTHKNQKISSNGATGDTRRGIRRAYRAVTQAFECEIKAYHAVWQRTYTLTNIRARLSEWAVKPKSALINKRRHNAYAFISNINSFILGETEKQAREINKQEARDAHFWVNKSQSPAAALCRISNRVHCRGSLQQKFYEIIL